MITDGTWKEKHWNCQFNEMFKTQFLLVDNEDNEAFNLLNIM